MYKRQGNNTTDGATKVLEDLLNAYPDGINLVLCHNDDTASGARNAIQAAGVTGIDIIGFDGNASAVELIASGDLTATVAQQPVLMLSLIHISAPWDCPGCPPAPWRGPWWPAAPCWRR